MMVWYVVTMRTEQQRMSLRIGPFVSEQAAMDYAVKVQTPAAITIMPMWLCEP